MTPVKVSIAAAIASILLLLVVFELIRSRRLRERYALLWLLTGVVLLALSLWRDGLNTIAGWFGVTGYPYAWTVTNLGTVESVGAFGVGIDLVWGGTITNGAISSPAALIAGTRFGIVTSTAGIAVHVISRPVCPWTGGPSESSSGRTRNVTTE